jgi:hypothetical protein
MPAPECYAQIQPEKSNCWVNSVCSMFALHMLECPAYAALRSHRFQAAVADAEQDTETATWRTLMKMKYDVVPGFILSAWMLRRAALTGREANGGNPMALPSVPATDIT